MCGFETDEDALTFHGRDNQALDLLPLVQGNIRHITDIRKSDRELDIEHREWVICIGRVPDDGFLLLSSAPYQEPGTQKARATL